MRKRLFAAFTAATVLGMAAQAASANRLSINERAVRLVFTRFAISYEGRMECPVTLEGSFHSSTTAKTANALVGHVSRASVRGTLGTSNCTDGTATIFQEALPWHLTYRGMTGTLPRPTGVLLNVVNARLRLDPLSVFLPACNTTTTTANPGVGRLEIEANGLVTGFTLLEEFTIPLEEGICPFGANARFGGTSRVTRLANTTNIRVTLI